MFFAICNAAKGGPPLLDNPYVGEKLDEQLDKAAGDFLNNRQRTYLTNNLLYVNMLFDWHAKQFPEGPAAFVRKYARGDLKERLDKLADKDLKVEFFEYDWALNGR